MAKYYKAPESSTDGGINSTADKNKWWRVSQFHIVSKKKNWEFTGATMRMEFISSG